jgi:hypothetical protein
LFASGCPEHPLSTAAKSMTAAVPKIMFRMTPPESLNGRISSLPHPAQAMFVSRR